MRYVSAVLGFGLGLALSATLLSSAEAPHVFTPAQKSYWAFQPVKKSPLPSVKNKAWVKTPLDAFILAKLEEKNLPPNPRADKLTLLRRATIDMTGLPPTQEEIQAFLSDKSPNAWEKVAGLLADLKARGMLKDTLVVWGGEFGRTPFVQGSPNDEKAGRDHNPWGFTIWMAGGGVKGGQVIGSTDEIGLRALEEPHHVYDIHASILNLLGLDHLRTTYLHNGRAERPTGTAGNLIPKLWA
jgi:hypothetical protein